MARSNGGPPSVSQDDHRQGFDELAGRLEALANRPSELVANDPSRLRLLEAAKKVIPELETPSEAAQRVMYGPFEIMGAKVAYDLDLFNILVQSKAPRTTASLAEETGADAALLTRLLKYVASLSMIKEVAVDLWGPSRLTRTLTIPTIAAGIPHHTENLGSAILALPDFLRRRNYRSPSGATDCAFASANTDAAHIFDWMGIHPDNLQNFMLWMGAHRLRNREWLDDFPFRDLVFNRRETDETPVFVDVGGGIGHQCKAVLEKFPDLKGRVILEDQAPTLAKALKVPRMESVEADFFEKQPVIDWSDAKSRIILSQLRDAMHADSMILIDDHVVPELRAHKTVMQMDMTMLLALAAEERTERHWRQLVESVGLNIEQIHCYDDNGGDSIMVVKLKD